jgi:phosphopantothenoylcysteine decarboxylase
MYEHPLTAEHLRIVKEIIGYNVVGPIGKHLACGDVGRPKTACILNSPTDYINSIGVGAMAEWKDIIRIVVDRFQLSLRDEHSPVQ